MSPDESPPTPVAGSPGAPARGPLGGESAYGPEGSTGRLRPSPHGAPSRVPGMPSPGQPGLGHCPRTLTRGSGWHASTTCNGPQTLLIATLPGSELTTGRHCRGVHPTAWRMQLDPSKCPVGSPYGCPQQPGDIHGRGELELQGKRPRAFTLAVVDPHRPCPHPHPADGHGLAGAVATRRRRRTRAHSRT